MGDLKAHFRERFKLTEAEAGRLLKIVDQDDRVVRRRTNQGVHPVHLIGPAALVEAEAGRPDTER